ncbi:hypothetical protein ACOME3_000821 [Neoechinorhynchus agilis]
MSINHFCALTFSALSTLIIAKPVNKHHGIIDKLFFKKGDSKIPIPIDVLNGEIDYFSLNYSVAISTMDTQQASKSTFMPPTVTKKVEDNSFVITILVFVAILMIVIKWLFCACFCCKRRRKQRETDQ